MFLTSVITAAAFFTSLADVNATVDSGGSASNISVRIQDNNVNDTLLEFFNNCTCVPYYQCEEINQYIIVGRAGLLGPPAECSDSNYRCCKTSGPNEEPKTGDMTTGKPGTNDGTTSSTTEKPSIGDMISKNMATNASCGVPRTTLTVKILNSETDSATAITGEHPWMVEIFQKKGIKKAYRFRCGGSLIHPKVVLTALHCVLSINAESLKVAATGQGMFQNLGINPDNERRVLKIVKHPKYYPGGLHNDIAFMILQTDFSYSNYPINSICLPDANQIFDGKKCLAVGWGQNRDHRHLPLKKVDVPIVNFDQCQDLLRETSLGSQFSLHESFLCAGGEEGKDTCNGDGGSPLICLGDDYNYIQAGIVSWGVNCGVVNEPGLYTNVAQFRDWIVEELQKYDLKI